MPDASIIFNLTKTLVYAMNWSRSKQKSYIKPRSKTVIIKDAAIIEQELFEKFIVPEKRGPLLEELEFDELESPRPNELEMRIEELETKVGILQSCIERLIALHKDP